MGLADFRLPEVYLAQSQTIAKLNWFNGTGVRFGKSLTKDPFHFRLSGVEGSN
jgi:hypothetical protein